MGLPSFERSRRSGSSVKNSDIRAGGLADTRLLLLNKPFGVLCQFTDEAGRRTLKDYVAVPGIYPAGRLDADSEGLVLLTGDGALQHRIADPRHKLAKRYLVQVDGEIDEVALVLLRAGLDLGDFRTQPCAARRIPEPDWLWPRDPPVRFRKSVPTSWVEIVLREGKNRQVRRMTAKVGHPTLRLVRVAIGPYRLGELAPGTHTTVAVAQTPRPRQAGQEATPPRAQSGSASGDRKHSRAMRRETSPCTLRGRRSTRTT